MFYLTSEIYVFGGITYLILSSGDLQSWAKVDKTSRDNGTLANDHK